MVALRGTASVEDLITDSVADPVPVARWVPEAFAAQHAAVAQHFHAHAGIMGAAEAVLAVRPGSRGLGVGVLRSRVQPCAVEIVATAARQGAQPGCA